MKQNLYNCLTLVLSVQCTYYYKKKNTKFVLLGKPKRPKQYYLHLQSFFECDDLLLLSILYKYF
jgi:hypothetical protein